MARGKQDVCIEDAASEIVVQNLKGSRCKESLFNGTSTRHCGLMSRTSAECLFSGHTDHVTDSPESLSDGAAKCRGKDSRLVFGRGIPRATSTSAFCISDNNRKVVQMQSTDGKSYKTSSKGSGKKPKSPDITQAVNQCRQSHRDYLDLSNMGLHQLPNNTFKDLAFLHDLFLYDNKLVNLPPTIGNLAELRRLLLQQNVITASGIPAEINKLVNLEELDLRYNRLDGSLPMCICKLTTLKQLLLTYNKLTSISDDVVHLKQLTVLVLSHNSIRDAAPTALGQLTLLKNLDLSFNQITSLPESIGNCTALRDVNLMHNQLTSLPSSIGCLVNLSRLALKYNQIAAIPASLARCTNLDELNVENNHVTTLPENLLKDLSQLQNINLSRNLFVSFPPGGPGQFCSCLSLILDHNQLTSVPADIFVGASNLTKLNLRDNNISELHPSVLQSLTNLEEMDVGSNQLHSLPAEIEALQRLKVLRLSYNQLKCLPNEIGKLSSLRILDLESNQLETLPLSIGQLESLQELNVLCNQLTTFPRTVGTLSNVKVIKAGENQICEIPPEIGNMASLRDLHLNDNPSLKSLPAELSQCSTLTILNLEGCSLCDLPQPIIEGGSAMIIYFLQQVLQLRRQQTAL